MKHLLLTSAMAILAGACAYTPTTGATMAYDGKYTGMISFNHVSAATCGSLTPKPAEMTVTNGSVVWATSPSGAPMYAPLSADGSFAVNENGTWLAGKVGDNGLIARTNSGACHMTYDLKKSA